MDNLKQILKKTWQNEVKKHFTQGLITYERQLQAIWYRALKDRLDATYEVWVEPSIYLSEDQDNSRKRNLAKPDLVITNKNLVEAVVELKCNPWGYPKFKGDLQKLVGMHNRDGYPGYIEMGWQPVSPHWPTQNSTGGTEKGYHLSTKVMYVMAAIAHPNTGCSQENRVQEAINEMNINSEPEATFWHFKGAVHFNSEINFSILKLNVEKVNLAQLYDH